MKIPYTITPCPTCHQKSTTLWTTEGEAILIVCQSCGLKYHPNTKQSHQYPKEMIPAFILTYRILKILELL